MPSIYETAAPSKAPRNGQAKGSLTGPKFDPAVVKPASGSSVRHVPNADARMPK